MDDNSKKRKREHDEGGSSVASMENDAPPTIQGRKWDKDDLGNDVLPPPSIPQEEATCWAQACVLAVEGNYRIMYAYYRFVFPTLSIRDCIYSFYTPENRVPPLLDDVYSWLQYVGVATHHEYEALGKRARTRYRTIGRSRYYKGKEIVDLLDNGLAIGYFYPDQTISVETHYCLRRELVKEQSHSEESDSVESDSSESESGESDAGEDNIGHLVVVMGYLELNGSLCLVYDNGYGAIRTMDVACMLYALILGVPNRPIEDY